MPDLTLDDLGADSWTQVARRIRATSYTDGWEWHLPPPEVTALLIAQQHGSVLVIHDRDETGRPVLKAKRVRQPDPVERFAVAGRGMFDK